MHLNDFNIYGIGNQRNFPLNRFEEILPKLTGPNLSQKRKS